MDNNYLIDNIIILVETFLQFKMKKNYIKTWRKKNLSWINNMYALHRTD